MLKSGPFDRQKRRYHFVICRLWHFAVKQVVQPLLPSPFPNASSPDVGRGALADQKGALCI